MADTKEMLTVEKAARMLGVSGSGLRNWARKGIIKCYRFTPNGNLFFSRAEIIAFRDAHAIAPETVVRQSRRPAPEHATPVQVQPDGSDDAQALASLVKASALPADQVRRLLVDLGISAGRGRGASTIPPPRNPGQHKNGWSRLGLKVGSAVSMIVIQDDGAGHQMSIPLSGYLIKAGGFILRVSKRTPEMHRRIYLANEKRGQPIAKGMASKPFPSRQAAESEHREPVPTATTEGA